METRNYPIRVVSSGQVYRQMFDAQVQLTQELKTAQLKSPTEKVINDSAIPLVHKEPMNEFLDNRQKTWCHSFPNDSNVENPVLYKRIRDYVSCQFYLEEDNVLSREVLNLPDVVKPANGRSGIIDRIASTRRKKHEELFEDMIQQISLISVKLEPHVQETAATTKTHLSDNDDKLEDLIEKITDDTDLLALSRSDLGQLWVEVISHRDERRSWINEMKRDLLNVETDRINMIRETFEKYGEMLEKIAYLMAPDLHRLLDREAQLINQTMLSNKRAYADLHMRMLCADIEREKFQRTYILRRTEAWRLLKRSDFERQFKDFMNSDMVRKPPGVENVKKKMKEDVSKQSRKRWSIIKNLTKFQPPKCSKSSIYQWNQEIIQLSQLIDDMNHAYIYKLHAEYERVCHYCLAEVERIKEDILRDNISSPDETDQLIAAEFLPLIGEIQTKFETELEKLDKHITVHTEEIAGRIRLLFLYSQGMAHLWDTHEIGLARQEQLLKEKLDECRHKHNLETKEREALLDTYMDKMRQDSKEKLLTESLKRVTDILELLRGSYETFYRSMTDIVSGYPDMVSDEIDVYENTLCLYFGIRLLDDDHEDDVRLCELPVKAKHDVVNTIVDICGDVETLGMEHLMESDESNEQNTVAERVDGGQNLNLMVVMDTMMETTADEIVTLVLEEGSMVAVPNIPDESVREPAELIPDTFNVHATTNKSQEKTPSLDDDISVVLASSTKSIPYNPETATQRYYVMSHVLLQHAPSTKSYIYEASKTGSKTKISKTNRLKVSSIELKKPSKLELLTIPTVVSDDDFGIGEVPSDEIALKHEYVERHSEQEMSTSFLAIKPSIVSYHSTLVTSVPMYEEILKTSSGKTFYVLTEACLRDTLVHKIPDSQELVRCDMSYDSLVIPPEIDSSQTGIDQMRSLCRRPAYIGEHLMPVDFDDTPTVWYLQLTHIAEAKLLVIKKSIRMNFLEYMDYWRKQSIDHGRSIIAAKKEELLSELDLRLHLHAPRGMRAELDIHNVRAAELVMHAERVKRHTEGIESALKDLLNAFSKATIDHNSLAMRFRSNIEALECVFINATKSSKLVALQNEVGVEMKKFMKVIRASLREFRRYLDETLQTLRESNARFIKSFRVFSDGGNFSPSELEVYRYKLEKVSQHIDQVEGDIMLELEGMESKRLDQASKVANEFDGRFKYHMLDLVFMEKIGRWFTNTQVRIKAEVANSNKQAKTISGHLKTLTRRIDACEKPNLDKEQVTSEELNASLTEIFTRVNERATYLACLVEEMIEETAHSPVTGACNTSINAKVGFAGSDVTVPALGLQPVVRSTKQIEDHAVALIRSILGKEKARTKPVEEATEFKLEVKERHRPYVAHPSQGNPGTQVSGHEKAKKTKTKESVATATSVDSVKTLTRRASKMSRWDKRFLVFGEEDEEVGKDFLSLVNEILRIALDGLLTISDIFYKQKGIRPITRPQALQENFDRCSEVIITKLLSYQKQAETFHNHSLQDYRQQTYECENVVSLIPPLLINDIFQCNVKLMRVTQDKLTSEFSETLRSLNKKKDDHSSGLRPALGHPQNSSELQKLCEEESARHTNVIDMIQAHIVELENNIVAHSESFMSDLIKVTDVQLSQYDYMTVIDDLQRGDTEARHYPTCELIRRKNLGLPLESVDEKPELPRGKGSWCGIPMNELVIESSQVTRKLSGTHFTSKTTLGHSATLKARDDAYLKYKKMFERTLKAVHEECEHNLHSEERWADSWNASVKRVQQLYATQSQS